MSTTRVHYQIRSVGDVHAPLSEKYPYTEYESMHLSPLVHMKLGITTKTRRGSWKFCHWFAWSPVTRQCLASGCPLKPSPMRKVLMCWPTVSFIAHLT